VVTGEEEMIGMQGTVLDDFSANRGRVWLHSESWQAESSSNLARDTNVRVTGINGLRLQVEPVSEHKRKGDAP
jgi:membrane-bound serine protease (ClpP class)